MVRPELADVFYFNFYDFVVDSIICMLLRLQKGKKQTMKNNEKQN